MEYGVWSSIQLLFRLVNPFLWRSVHMKQHNGNEQYFLIWIVLVLDRIGSTFSVPKRDRFAAFAQTQFPKAV